MGWGPLESDVPGTRPRAERLAGCPWPSCGRRMIFLPPLSLDFLRIAKDKVQCGRAAGPRAHQVPLSGELTSPNQVGGGTTINDVIIAALAGAYRRRAIRQPVPAYLS